MTQSARIARLGFDSQRLSFALRTALTACAALLAAWALGLEHPQWSGMTVWAASLPARGQLFEKSFFRFAGTVSGVVVGVGLVWLSSYHMGLLVAGLAVWIGLCAGIGNLQRGFVAYGTMLAGYSAAMVALLGTTHPDHILALGLDRLLTITVGVLAALISGWLVLPRGSADDLTSRVHRLTARVLISLSDHFDRRAPPQTHGVLSEIAALEDQLDPHSAGSRRSRRTVRAIRALLIADVAALLWLKQPPAGPQAALAATLRRAAAALEDEHNPGEAIRALDQGAALAADEPGLSRMIADLGAALAVQAAIPRPEHFSVSWKPQNTLTFCLNAFSSREPVSTSLENALEAERSPPPVILHHDWIGARQALIRASGTMAAAGTMWLATGWSAGPYMMLGLAIMISLFSAFDNPARMMRFVAAGQLLGVIGALACRWLVWPLADSSFELVLLTMPFILLGVLIVGHQRTVPFAFDYNMVLLLLLQPSYPLTGSFDHALVAGAAVVSAPLTALAVYSLIYPVNARRRMDMLITMMVHDVSAMAASHHPQTDRPIWRARLYHRLLRLIRWAQKSGEQEASAVDGGLAVFALGRAVLALHDLLERPDVSANTARRLSAALGRLRDLAGRPERAAQALDRAARKLTQAEMTEAGVVREAARALTANLAFFRRAERS